MDVLIEAAYRQIFFHAFKSDREIALESQLRNKQITVRDFIRGLLLSETYRNSFYEKNSNYRFVEHCVQKVLGRDVYSEREKIAWSIVVVNKGIKGLVDELLNSDEYLENFGYDIVPYQRRRNLPSRELGERPFNIKSPRYDAYHRGILGFPQVIWQNQVRRFVPQEKQAKAGDPSLYLNMARSINAKPAITPRVSTGNIGLDKVPYRR
jgi:phycobilisome rod-core linker protein